MIALGFEGRFYVSKRGGIGGGGWTIGHSHDMLYTWWQSWLAVERPWSALAGPILSFLAQMGTEALPILVYRAAWRSMKCRMASFCSSNPSRKQIHYTHCDMSTISCRAHLLVSGVTEHTAVMAFLSKTFWRRLAVITFITPINPTTIHAPLCPFTIQTSPLSHYNSLPLLFHHHSHSFLIHHHSHKGLSLVCCLLNHLQLR